MITEADVDALQSVLGSVYCALEVPFDPVTVGSVSTAGGPDDPAGSPGRAG